MFYKGISISGFGPHSNKKTYEFPCGTVFITGKNGSGKSTIFDAIQWCLFGPAGSSRTLKDRLSIINISRQTATVCLSLSHETHGDVSITRKLTRSGKHSISINVNGETREGGIKDNQEYINSLCCDMRHDVFSSVYMMQSSPLVPPTSFIGSTPAQRRQLLSHLVDPRGDFLAAHKTIKNALRDVKKDISSYEGKLEATTSFYHDVVIPQPPESSSAEIAEEIKELEKTARGGGEAKTIMSQKREMERLSEQFESLKKEHNNAVQRNEELDEDIDLCSESISAVAHDVRTMKKSLSYISAQSHIADYIVDEYDRKEDILRNHMDSLVAEENKLSALHDVFSGYDGKKCPLCGNECHHISIDYSDDINAVHEDIDTINNAINDIAHKRNSVPLCDEIHNHLIKEYEPAKNQYHDEKHRMTKLNEEKDTIESRIESLAADIEDTEGKIGSYQYYLDHYPDNDKIIDSDTLYRKKVDVQAQEKLIEDKKKEKENLHDKMNALSAYLDNAYRKKQQLENLKEQTSPDGAMSDDISAIMSNISTHASQLYSDFFDGEDDIVISDGESDGEKTCVLSCGDRDVATYSHGEQLRIYGCVQAAFTTAVYEKTDMWIPMMWDEPSLATDSDVVASIFSLPAHVTPEYHQSFVITREDIDDASYEHIINLDE